MLRAMLGAMIGATLPTIGSAASLRAQKPDPPRRPVLATFDGVYAYHGNTSIILVATDTNLFAVLDEAKYPLRALGNDRFLNGAGDTIPFRRGANGVVTGFVERGVFFERRDPNVDPEIAADVRATARPLGPGGRPLAIRYVMPADMGDGIQIGNAADVGLDSASVIQLVSRVVDGTYPDVHSILAFRSGKLVVEEYFYAYDRDRKHQMRSATKSVVSALAGIAIDRGLLLGEDELVTKRLPYQHYAAPDARKEGLTIKDLLTMRSGLACDDWDANSPGNESRVYQSADWVKYVLDLPMLAAPGTHGSYCSGNVAVVGRIIERAANKSLPAFAQENLFSPLGIRARDIRWNYTLDSTNASTFGQLYMRPRDMLKLGVLFHQHGQWAGRQIISREWVARSTAKWSTVGDQDYGYFWWHQRVNVSAPEGTRRVDVIDATGNGGQKIYIVPSLDLVVVLTGGRFNANSAGTTILINDLLPPLLRRTGRAER
jgi:CubicO group peptidase (beta-lactamase class C family)